MLLPYEDKTPVTNWAARQSIPEIKVTVSVRPARVDLPHDPSCAEPNKLYFHEAGAHTQAGKLSEPLGLIAGLLGRVTLARPPFSLRQFALQHHAKREASMHFPFEILKERTCGKFPQIARVSCCDFL
jgi:hypothetical protein